MKSSDSVINLLNFAYYVAEGRQTMKFVAGDVVKGRYRVRFVARGDAESQEGR